MNKTQSFINSKNPSLFESVKQNFGVVRLWSTLALASVVFVACHPPASSVDAQQQSLDDALEKTAQILDSIKCIVPSPQGYKQLWLDINADDNTLGRALMTHYMGCSGTPFRLTEKEFRKLPLSIVPVEFGPMFLRRDFIDDVVKNRIGKVGDKIVDVDETILAATHYGNTLGNFQLELRGRLVWRQNEFGKIVPHFTGQARALDRYDFNPSESSLKNSWRGNDTELRVRLAHVGLPGKAFDIESEWMNYKFDFPKYDSDLIQESENSEKSGYSAYGEQAQAILMTELRSSRWEKAGAGERIKIIITTMRRLYQSARSRSFQADLDIEKTR